MDPGQTNSLDVGTMVFILVLTFMLVSLTLYHAQSSIKKHVNTSSTVDALFTDISVDYLK
jgi:hypothetical protein